MDELSVPSSATPFELNDIKYEIPVAVSLVAVRVTRYQLLPTGVIVADALLKLDVVDAAVEIVPEVRLKTTSARDG